MGGDRIANPLADPWMELTVGLSPLFPVHVIVAVPLPRGSVVRRTTIGLSGATSGVASGAIGSVQGTFHGQRIDVTLSAKGNSEYVHFNGTIGGDKINGAIGPIHQHGGTSTVRATFDVTM